MIEAVGKLVHSGVMDAAERLDVRLQRLVQHAGARGFTFDELARAATQVGVDSLTAVVDWLATARTSGGVEDMGFDVLPDGSGCGPRRYRERAADRDEDTGHLARLPDRSGADAAGRPAV